MHLANIHMGDFCTHFYNRTRLCVYKEARFTDEYKDAHVNTQLLRSRAQQGLVGAPFWLRVGVPNQPGPELCGCAVI